MEEELKIDPDTMQKVLKSAEQEIIRAVRDRISWNIADILKTEAKDQVVPIVAQFVQEEILPAVMAHLTQNKEMILASCVKAAETVTQELAEALVKKAQAAMRDSWKVDDIIRAVFAVDRR